MNGMDKKNITTNLIGFLAVVILGYFLVSGDKQTYALSEDEKAVLAFSSEDASEDVKNVYRRKVINLARPAELAEINNCVANPVVTEVRHGESAAVKNLDKIDHELIFGKDAKVIEVLSGQIVEFVPSEFYKGRKGTLEIFRYRCRNLAAGFTGIFVITDVPPPYD